MDLQNYKIQEWSDFDRQSLLDSIKENIQRADFEDIRIVGSRITDYFFSKSDIDVIVMINDFGLTNNNLPLNYYWNDIRISIFLRDSLCEKNRLVYGKYKLSSFSLLKNEMFIGENQEEFWDKRLNNEKIIG